jgi:hypothetical protein
MSVLEPYGLTEISYGLIRWDLLYNSNLAIIRNELAKGSDVIISAGQNLAKDDAFIVGTNNYAYKAKADGSTLWPAMGMVLSSTIGSGGSGYAKLFGGHTVTTTLTTIGLHYLHPSTPGAITPIKPVEYIQPLVEALSLISVLVNPLITPDKYRFVDVSTLSTISAAISTIGERVVSNRMFYLRDRAMGGDMSWELLPNSWSSYASTLNAKAAGTYSKSLMARLKTAGGYVHDWFVGTIGYTAAENASDAQIGAPALDTATDTCVSGQAIVVATYDTDAGATKTYAAGDSITVQINTMSIMGYVLPAATFIDSIQ